MASNILHYRTLGTGPLLVICHGLLGSGRNWLGIAKRLAPYFTVLLIDLRNHGHSFHADTMHYTDMAADISRILDPKISHILLGHSMGGKVAMQVAHDNPALVHQLMVVDMAPKAYALGRQTPLLEACLALDLTTIQTRKQADLQLSHQTALKNKPSYRAFLLQNLVSDQPGKFHWRIPLATLLKQEPAIMAMPQLTHTITMPSLFIYGDQSHYVVPDDHATIHHLFSQATIIALPGGHWLHAEHPEPLCQAILTETKAYQ